jgi:hypothetical protein
VQNTDVYALQRSELNGFLFADVGTEANGMTLSVLSALSRLGMDPWAEAARLARLPRNSAVDGLARLIAGMPGSLWPMADATPIAARLVALLPSGGGSAAAAPAMARPPAGIFGAKLVALVQGTGRPSLKGSLKPGSVMPSSPRQWTIVVVLLAAVLAALTLNITGYRPALFQDKPTASVTTTAPKPPSAQ